MTSTSSRCGLPQSPHSTTLRSSPRLSSFSFLKTSSVADPNPRSSSLRNAASSRSARIQNASTLILAGDSPAPEVLLNLQMLRRVLEATGVWIRDIEVLSLRLAPGCVDYVHHRTGYIDRLDIHPDFVQTLLHQLVDVAALPPCIALKCDSPEAGSDYR